MISHAWLLIPAQQYVAQMLQSLAEYPARQEPASSASTGAGEAGGRDHERLTRTAP
jgi:hypothetical protein